MNLKKTTTKISVNRRSVEWNSERIQLIFGAEVLELKNVVSMYMLKSTVFIHSYRCKKGNVGLDCF